MNGPRTFRALRNDEEETGYGVIVDSVAWQKVKGIQLWERPLPRDVYAKRQQRGENFGLFVGDSMAAVISLARGAPPYWKDAVSDPAASWLCTLATAQAHHGTGAGRAAVECALEYLRRMGEPEVRLDCKPGFLEGFYKALGFRPVTTKTMEMGRPDLPCRCIETTLMHQDLWPDVKIRSATDEDIAALCAIRGRAALHRDRIGAADGTNLEYLVIERGNVVLGFGCLVLRQPPTWPAMPHLPQMVDLNVAPGERGQGIGSRLIREMERITRAAGYADIGLAVNPEKSPRALALYKRLGYVPLSETPVEDVWEFTDSDGVKHQGREMLIYLRRRL